MLLDPDFRDKDISSDAYSFAGLEDDLVFGGSEDGDMFVWSLPNGSERDCSINRSLFNTKHKKTLAMKSK